MLITKRAHGRVMVIHLAGKFEGGPDREKLLKITSKAIADGYRELVISFLGVRFLASNGIGILISMRKLMDEVGGRVVLCNLNERVLSVVHVMRLQEIFTLESNIRTARTWLRATRSADSPA